MPPVYAASPWVSLYVPISCSMERNPVALLQRRAPELLATARAAVAQYVGTEADDIVFFPNPTTAINMVANSLQLVPGDDYVERVWSMVTPRTRVLFLDQLTSSTALILPVHELCRRARAAGMVSIVDGAHVSCHIPLDISSIGCDIFTGALHKWLCAPKGCSIHYASKEAQQWLKPLVTAWGWESDHPSASRVINYHEWQGPRDPSPFLTAPLPVWHGHPFIRVSFAAYNTEADSDAVVAALQATVF